MPPLPWLARTGKLVRQPKLAQREHERERDRQEEPMRRRRLHGEAAGAKSSSSHTFNTLKECGKWYLTFHSSGVWVCGGA